MAVAVCVAAFLLAVFACEASSNWVESKSGEECTRTDIAHPPLVVISMDGFAASYLKRGVTPNIDQFGRGGVRAQHIYSTYPTRTFVNHYTMATGLWAESHGIVDNNIWEPSISNSIEDMTKTTVHGFYKGEPIWSAYKRQTGGKTACLFWAGCEMNVTDFNPDYNPAYDSSMTNTERMDMILSWLKMPPSTRPALIMAYFAEPDHSGHFKKSNDEVTKALQQNDAAIDYLMSGIETAGLLDCVNIVLVSDHGMTDVKTHIYYDEHISLDGLVAVYGVVGRIYRNQTDRPSYSITGAFECTNGSVYRVYDRATLPARYHYSGTSRVGDYIFEGQPGTTFYATKADDWFLSGDHGYDYINQDMRTIFFARGPAFKSGVIIPAFQNVEYFHIFEDLLGLQHNVSTNGTLGVIDEMFNVVPERKEMLYTISGCPMSSGDQLTPCTECTMNELTEIAGRISSCDSIQCTFSPLTSLSPHTDYCSLRLCEFEALTTLKETGPRVFIEQVTYGSYTATPRSCVFETAQGSAAACPRETNIQTGPTAPKDTIVYKNLLLNNLNALSGYARGRVALYDGFVRTFLNPLDTMIGNYAGLYGRLVVTSGVVYDYDHNGIADARVNASLPSHVFRVLMACPEWRQDRLGCVDPKTTRTLAFVLPHVERDLNCMPSNELLLAYTARVADVESMTGLRFFADPNVVPPEVAVKLRAFVATSLWPQ